MSDDQIVLVKLQCYYPTLIETESSIDSEFQIQEQSNEEMIVLVFLSSCFDYNFIATLVYNSYSTKLPILYIWLANCS